MKYTGRVESEYQDDLLRKMHSDCERVLGPNYTVLEVSTSSYETIGMRTWIGLMKKIHVLTFSAESRGV